MKRKNLIVSILAGVVLVILLWVSGVINYFFPQFGASQNSPDAALSMMLTGYTRWQTLQGEAQFTWYDVDGKTQSQTNKFSLVLPNKIYVDVTGDIGPNVPGMWISDGQNIYNVDKKAKTYTQMAFPQAMVDADNSKLPTDLNQLKHAGGVITHPLVKLIVAPIGKYLFPIWFPQGYIGDKYSVQKEENFLGRKVWVIENDTIYNDNLTAWVDQESGIILKYSQIVRGKKAQEMTFTAFQLNGQISSDIFGPPSGYSLVSP